MGLHDVLPWDRVPLPPREELCGDVQRKEDQQMHQVERARRQVFRLRLRRTRSTDGRELGRRGNIIGRDSHSRTDNQ